MSDHSIKMSYAQWDFMRRYVIAQAPLEACGLLAGKNGVVEDVLPVKNAAASPVRYRMEPKAQLRAFEHMEVAGQEILAIFHSHPKGSSEPSPTDIREASYAVVQIIWSPVGRRWRTRAFWFEAGKAIEVALNVEGM